MVREGIAPDMKRLGEYSGQERMRMLETVSRVFFDTLVSVRYALPGESFAGTSKAEATDSGCVLIIKPGQSLQDEYKSWISALAFLRTGMLESKEDHDLWCHRIAVDCYHYNIFF
jgi:hypothetical protein